MAAEEPTWRDSLDFLRSLPAIPGAQANADLLAGAEAQWTGRVVPRTSMFDLLFTLPGDPHPFAADLRVTWESDVFELRFHRGGLLVSADRCRAPNAQAVLGSFLRQLTST
jgi:hypothetical protein